MSCKTLQLLVIALLLFLPELHSQTNEQLRANLYAFNADGTADLYDGNLTMYSIDNSDAVDNKDAVKMPNFGENFGLLRGATTLVIERRASIVNADTTFFKMWNMCKKTYKIELWLTGLDHPGLTGILEDTYLSTKTMLNLNAGNEYTFTITDVPASLASDRFRIIFSKLRAVSSPLPIAFTEIKTYTKNNEVNVEWTIKDQKNVMQYQVQKSVNGRPFYTASTIMAEQKNSLGYKWTDVSYSINDLYRISSIDKSGLVQYSAVLNISDDVVNKSILVYPNPVINGVINLKFTGMQKGIYTAKIINDYGQLLFIARIQHSGGNSLQKIQLNKAVGKGNYDLEIITPGNNIINSNVFLL